MVIAAVLVIAMVIAGTLGFTYLGKEETTKYYAVEIYVLNWDLNTTELEQGVDVRFQISIDSDGDGDFDAVGQSQVFTNTTVEIAPFRYGTTIPTSVATFNFKVDVYKIVGTASSPMIYADAGPSPINQGSNLLNSTLAWSYDATAGSSDDLACRLSYFYFVNDTAN